MWAAPIASSQRPPAASSSRHGLPERCSPLCNAGGGRTAPPHPSFLSLLGPALLRSSPDAFGLSVWLWAWRAPGEPSNISKASLPREGERSARLCVCAVRLRGCTWGCRPSPRRPQGRRGGPGIESHSQDMQEGLQGGRRGWRHRVRGSHPAEGGARQRPGHRPEAKSSFVFPEKCEGLYSVELTWSPTSYCAADM